MISDDGDEWWLGAQAAARAAVTVAAALIVQNAQPQTFQDEPAQAISWVSEPTPTARASIAPVHFRWHQPDERPTPAAANLIEEQDAPPLGPKPPDWTYVIWATDEEVIPVPTFTPDDDPRHGAPVSIPPARWFAQSDDESAFAVARDEESLFPVAFSVAFPGMPWSIALLHQDEIGAAPATLLDEELQFQAGTWLPAARWWSGQEQDERAPTPFEDDAFAAGPVQLAGVAQVLFDGDERPTPATPLTVDEEYPPIIPLVPQPTGWQVWTQDNEDVPALVAPPAPVATKRHGYARDAWLAYERRIKQSEEDTLLLIAAMLNAGFFD